MEKVIDGNEQVSYAKGKKEDAKVVSADEKVIEKNDESSRF